MERWMDGEKERYGREGAKERRRQGRQRGGGENWRGRRDGARDALPSMLISKKARLTDLPYIALPVRTNKSGSSGDLIRAIDWWALGRPLVPRGCSSVSVRVTRPYACWSPRRRFFCVKPPTTT